MAVEQSRLTINQMARRAQESLFDAFALLSYYSEENYRRVVRLETLVDRYEDKIGTYLIRITGRELSAKQNSDVTKYLHTLSDFERISDHALNVAEAAKEIAEKKIEFSMQGKHEMDVLLSAVTEIVTLSFDAFIDNKLEQSYRVEPLEEVIDNICVEMKLHHVERLQNGICTLGNGFVFNDMLTYCERIADHCSNIAIAMIELAGQTFDTHQYLIRLREKRTHNFDLYYESYSRRFSL